MPARSSQLRRLISIGSAMKTSRAATHDRPGWPEYGEGGPADQAIPHSGTVVVPAFLRTTNDNGPVARPLTRRKPRRLWNDDYHSNGRDKKGGRDDGQAATGRPRVPRSAWPCTEDRDRQCRKAKFVLA